MLKGPALGICAISGSCAIGVPFFVKNFGNSSPESQLISAQGGASEPLRIEECKTPLNDRLKNIEFGDPESTKVCWTIDEKNQKLKNREDVKSYYTKLFKDMWNHKLENWNAKNSGNWKSQCLTIEDKWVMTNMEGGREFLGWCSDQDSEKWFIKKDLISSEKETENKIIKLYYCSGECFDEKSQSGSTQINQFEKENGEWVEIKFKNQ